MFHFAKKFSKLLKHGQMLQKCFRPFFKFLFGENGFGEESVTLEHE